jgi:hypothetical protein
MIRAHKTMTFGESDGAPVTPTTKQGYLTYSDGEGSYIWVKEAAVPTTFVLSNEEGGLIDQLIADGYGDGSLYEAVLVPEPASGALYPWFSERLSAAQIKAIIY